ncbi:hypothetical protein FQN57_005236 [Myotisia sp. PD_48]|nr:hypothetical protein FQN57_005236 [Myotisia sp. PD_48]
MPAFEGAPGAVSEPEAIPVPARTNEELNLAVLQRHNPEITSILSLAQYAVVYLFNVTTQLWEKIGIEGSLFVCQLTQGNLGEERYSVFILNRRSMDNFEARLADGNDIEITDEYIILQVDSHYSGTDVPSAPPDHERGAIRTGRDRKSIIYGLWIFSEQAPSSTAEARTLNAQIIKECAVHAGESRKFAEEREAIERSQHTAQATYSTYTPPRDEDPAQGGVAMGRQISLRELFGQQRAQDDAWSVKVHSPARGNDGPHVDYPPPAQAAQLPQGAWGPDGNIQSQNSGSGNFNVGDMFRKVGIGYQGQ